MNRKGACLISAVLLWSMGVGCTKGNPQFGVLDASRIPQPTFQGATSVNKTVNSATATTAISGECDTKTQSITAIAVGGSLSGTLASVATTTPIIGCSSDGKFSFTLDSLSTLGYTPEQGQKYTVELRSVTTSGLSNPSSIIVTYDATYGSGSTLVHLAAGGSALLVPSGQTTTTATLLGRVRLTTHAKTISDGTYTAVLGVSAQ